MRFIKWLNEISKKDILLVGGKGANLGEVASIVQIPPGFVVTSEAFLYFLNTTGLRDKIKEIIKEFISRGDPDEYEKASAVIRGLIERSPLPSDLEREIAESYKKLCEVTGVNNVAVAVRSSATAEDIPEASFAGQQDTYLNVRGVENVIHYVKKVWSSLYTARALYYRDKMGIPHEKSLMAVVVQKLVNAKSAGVIFTLDPTTGDRSRVVIEASWGLGEGVVRGIVTPDEYVVDKKTLSIVERRISVKKVAVVRDESGLT
ncbi:MAG: PEP/pyruvate-binding domain-containing protein, partial [Pyrobaculum sp.]